VPEVAGPCAPASGPDLAGTLSVHLAPQKGLSGETLAAGAALQAFVLINGVSGGTLWERKWEQLCLRGAVSRPWAGEVELAVQFRQLPFDPDVMVIAAPVGTADVQGLKAGDLAPSAGR
jgi:hypothetical protein